MGVSEINSERLSQYKQFLKDIAYISNDDETGTLMVELTYAEVLGLVVMGEVYLKRIEELEAESNIKTREEIAEDKRARIREVLEFAETKDLKLVKHWFIDNKKHN